MFEELIWKEVTLVLRRTLGRTDERLARQVTSLEMPSLDCVFLGGGQRGGEAGVMLQLDGAGRAR